jgi:hypothetical protein
MAKPARVCSAVSLGISFIILALALSSSAQVSFERTYGGSYSDCGYSVDQTTDGGYVIAGWTGSFGAGGGDVYLIKTDSLGDILWSETYGTSPGSDIGHSVRQDSDGCYVIAGHTLNSGVGGSDVYVLKADSSGNLVWSRTYGGFAVNVGWSVEVASDGGYVIAGYTSSDDPGDTNVYLVKTDASGNDLWTRTYGGSHCDWGSSIRKTSDGGYIITGRTKSFGAGDYDVYLIKTDSSGELLWSETYGGPSSDGGLCALQTSDGGYVITGWTASFGAGGHDVYLIKTDSLGFELWSETYGETDTDCGYSIDQTSDGGYVIGGSTRSGRASWEDLCLIKADPSGNLVWQRTFGGASDECGYSVGQTADGGYITAGYTRSYGAGQTDVYLIKTDQDGLVSTGSKFKVRFKAPDGSPHPCDLTISDGSWMQEFDSVTYVETIVPETATYTVSYDWLSEYGDTVFGFLTPVTLTLPPSQLKAFDFYCHHPDSIAPRSKVYLSWREVGADETLSSWYDSTNLTLNYDVSFEAGKILLLSLIIGNQDPSVIVPMVYGVEALGVGGTWEPNYWGCAFCAFGPGACFSWQPGSGGSALLRQPELDRVEVTDVVKFAGIDSSEGAVGVYGLFCDDARIEGFETELRCAETGEAVEQALLYPQYLGSVSRNPYTLDISSLPLEFPIFELPIWLQPGHMQVLRVYPPQKEALEDFTFGVIAENPTLKASYSGLHHAVGDSLSVDVSVDSLSHDWWGGFVLPDSLMAITVAAHSDTASLILRNLHDYILNPAGSRNLVVTRIPADISRLRVTYGTARALKSQAVTELKALKRKGDKKLAKEIDRIIEHIQNSLGENLWLDGCRLDSDFGKRVFHEEKKATKRLMALGAQDDGGNNCLKKPKSGLGDLVERVIFMLVDADEGIAKIAVRGAQVGGGGWRKVQKAEMEISEAEKERVRGRYDKAIDHYKKAWEHAGKALAKQSGGGIQVALNRAGPLSFGLRQNSPNPFTRETRVSFNLPVAGHATVSVFDAMGGLVATLVDGCVEAGVHTATWDRSNAASGVYFCVLTSGGRTSTRKMVAVR